MENKNIYENEDRSYRAAILSVIRGSSDDDLMRSLLDDYHGNDIAAILYELTEEENDRLVRVLGNEAMAEILAYLDDDDAGEYLSEMEADDAAEIIEQMDADEALEVLETLDEETRLEVFELIEDEVKHEIELLDSYDEDEFGSVMSTNFIAISKNLSKRCDAQAYLRGSRE